MRLLLYIVVWLITGFLLMSLGTLVANICCRWHVRRYCRRNWLNINNLMLHREVFDLPGVLATIDCTDVRKKRFFVELCVTSFGGVRDLLTKEKLRRDINYEWRNGRPLLPTRRKIKLMADYECWPLWEASPGKVGDINPASLPISDSLRDELRKWKQSYDSILNRSDPASSAFPNEAAEQEFKKTGFKLAKRLQQELGDGFEVIPHC